MPIWSARDTHTLVAAVRAASVLAAGLVGAGCGDDTEAADGGGGSGDGGSSSASLTTSGGDDSPARGAWSLSFESPGSECNVEYHIASVGNVEPGGDVEYKTDGQDGATVTCAVVANGDGFDVTGSIAYKGQSLAIEVSGLRESATPDATIPGSTTFTTGKTAEEYSGSDCIFYLEESDSIGAGEARGSFRCTEVSAGASVCAVQQGYFALSDCDVD